MRSFVSPLGYGLLIASFMVSWIHLATAACTNTTKYVVHSIEATHVEGRFGKYNVEKHLDFISCPSSGNVSCTLPAKNYTLTIAPQFTISATNSSFKHLEDLMDDSHIIDLPLNSSDRKAIIEYMEGFWVGRPHFYLATSPLEVTISSKNISSHVDLTVEPGYNMTLTYASLRASNWVRYAQCDNKSLDGNIIGAIMPYYARGQEDTHAEINGQFLVSKQFLNDTVPEESSGIGLKAGSGWATTLIVFGVLAFDWL